MEDIHQRLLPTAEQGTLPAIGLGLIDSVRSGEDRVTHEVLRLLLEAMDQQQRRIASLEKRLCEIEKPHNFAVRLGL